MAIKGLVPQLAERGKIKCGGLGEKRKKQGKDEYFRLPQKHDHFTITLLQRNEAGDLISDKTLMEKINPNGGKLTEIPVRLLYNDPELNFPTRLACYKGSRAWCTGNGEWAQRFEQGESSAPGKYGRVPCPCERWDPLYTKPDKCRSLGTLQVMIDGVERVGGVWKFRTTSYNSITNLLSSMALILQVTGGRLAGLPLSLVLSPKTVTVPATGQPMVVFVASLEYRGTIEELRRVGYDLKKEEIEHQVRMDLLEDQARKIEIPLHEEPAAEQAETAGEFYPDADPGNVVTILTETKTTSSEPQDGNGKPESKGKAAPEPERTEATATDAQAAGKTGGQTAETQTLKPAALTLPEVMDLAKRDDAMVDLPIPLQTSKGVYIGRWLDWGMNLREQMQLTIELLPNLPEIANGLTVAMIEKSFKEAKLNLVIQEAMPEQEAKERIAGEQGTAAQDGAQQGSIPQGGRSTAAPPKGGGNGKQEPRRSLF